MEADLAQQDSLDQAATQWTKREYVPVTSFIHSVRFDNWRRIYQAYETPEGYYANDFYTPQTFAGDSIYDQSKSWTLKNTFAVALLEGFNKWAKAGLKPLSRWISSILNCPTYCRRVTHRLTPTG